MPRSADRRRGDEAFWGVYELGVLAGVLPLIAIGGYEVIVDTLSNDDIYDWQVVVGPTLIAATCAPRVGRRRAVQIALVGIVTAAILYIVLWFFLVGIGFGA